MDDRDILLPTVHRYRIVMVEARVDAMTVVDMEMDAKVEGPNLQ